MIEILYFLVLLLAAFSIGRWLLNFFNLKIDFYETLVFSLALGLGIFSYIGFLLGAFDLLYKSIIWAFVIIAIFIFRKNIFQLANDSRNEIGKARKIKGLESILWIILLFFVIINLVASLAPPFLWDEMSYNLAFPKVYARHHGFMNFFDNWRAFFPFNINMLFTLGIVLKNGILGKMFMFAYGTLLAAGIFSFTSRFFSRRAGLFATLAFYTMPMVSSHIGSAYIDMAVAFYVFLSFYCMLLWIESGKNSCLILSAIMSGLSTASKHTALFYLSLMGLAIFYKSLFLDKKPAYLIKKLLIFFIIVFALASPWYIRSYMATNNPVWPFASNVFESRNWDSNFNKESFEIGWFYYGHERSLTGFLTSLWDATMHSSKYMMLLGFGPLFLAFLPLVVFIRKFSRIWLLLISYSLLSLIIWYIAAQEIRMLMAYAVFAVIVGVIINELFNLKYAKYVIAILLLSLLSFNLVLWYGANSKKIPFVFGLESERDFYLKLKDHNGYDVFQYINDKLPKDARLLIFRDVRGYLSGRDYMISTEYSQKTVDLPNIADKNALYRRLKELGITHVFINTKLELFQPGAAIQNFKPYVSEKSDRMMMDMLKDGGKLVYENNGIMLYALQ